MGGSILFCWVVGQKIWLPIQSCWPGWWWGRHPSLAFHLLHSISHFHLARLLLSLTGENDLLLGLLLSVLSGISGPLAPAPPCLGQLTPQCCSLVLRSPVSLPSLYPPILIMLVLYNVQGFLVVCIGKNREKCIYSIFLEVEALVSFIDGDFFSPTPRTLKILKNLKVGILKLTHSLLLVLNILCTPKT